jgi:hypothetical protein
MFASAGKRIQGGAERAAKPRNQWVRKY